MLSNVALQTKSRKDGRHYDAEASGVILLKLGSYLHCSAQERSVYLLHMLMCHRLAHTDTHMYSFNRLKISSRISFLAQAFELLSVDRLQG